MITTFHIPSPGEIPTVSPTDPFTVQTDYILGGGDVLFTDTAETFLTFRHDGADGADESFVNNGEIWSVHDDAYISLTFRDYRTIENNGLIAVINTDTVDYGILAPSYYNGNALAILIDAGRTQFLNTGKIYAIAEGGYAFGLTSYITPPKWFDLNSIIDNSGEIYAEAAYDAYGIRNINNTNIDNSGTIIVSAGRNAIAVNNSGSEGTITNSGLIEAVSQYAGVPGYPIGSAIGISIWHYAKIVNFGTIRADIAIIADRSGSSSTGGSERPLELENSGEIYGDILSGGGYDIITNTGHIFDNIYAGNGDDLITSTDGFISGIVYGGFGDDRIYLGADDNIAHGGEDDDFLSGGNGNDQLYGNDGDDHIIGGLGNDTLYGGHGDDLLVISGGDIALGGDDNDTFKIINASFVLLDGGAHTDTVNVASRLRLNISEFIAADRLVSIEAFDVDASAGIALRAEDASNLSAGNTLTVSGQGGLMLYGASWTINGTRNFEGIEYTNYEASGANIWVSSELNLVIDTDVSEDFIGVRDASGPAASDTAPLPTYFETDSSGAFYLQGSFTIHQDETYRAISSDYDSAGATVFSTSNSYGDLITNEGRIEAIGTTGLRVFYESDGTITETLQDHSAYAINARSDWSLDNSGEIYSYSSGSKSQAVYIFLGDVFNSGLIEAVSGDDTATAIRIDHSELYNTGNIIASHEVLSDSYHVPVSTAVSSKYSFIDNSGLIYSESANLAIAVDLAETSGDYLVNSGRIIAVSSGEIESIAIRLWYGGETTITNSGEITGDMAIYVRDTTIVTNLYNSGVINGDIILSDLHVSYYAALVGDFIENSGVINGNIDMGNGDETYITIDGGILNGELHLGEGDDSAIMGHGNDIVFGDEGDDIINGGGGNDILSGGQGKDTFIFGFNSGADIITDFDIETDNIILAGNPLMRDHAFSIMIENMATLNSDGDVVLLMGDGSSIILNGITLDDLGDINFRVSDGSDNGTGPLKLGTIGPPKGSDTPDGNATSDKKYIVSEIFDDDDDALLKLEMYLSKSTDPIAEGGDALVADIMGSERVEMHADLDMMF